MFGLTDDQLNSIKAALTKELVNDAWIFGSRAKGNFRAGSDVDIAIIGDAQKVSYLLNEETTLPFFFDIVDVRDLTNQNLKDHIARVGVKII